MNDRILVNAMEVLADGTLVTVDHLKHSVLGLIGSETKDSRLGQLVQLCVIDLVVLR